MRRSSLSPPAPRRRPPRRLRRPKMACLPSSSPRSSGSSGGCGSPRSPTSTGHHRPRCRCRRNSRSWSIFSPSPSRLGSMR